MVGNAIREICCERSAHEGYGVDGGCHILRLDSVGVAQAGDESWVEVAQGAGANDNLKLKVSGDFEEPTEGD